MSVRIKLDFTTPVKLMVAAGDKISPKIPIAVKQKEFEDKDIHIARLLHINPSNLPKYLKKKIGEEIKSGDVIAEKKGFFSSSRVKSPIEGHIKEIDLKKGTLTIAQKAGSDIAGKERIEVPVHGRVVKATEKSIELEIEGHIYKGEKGAGEESVGKLYFFSKEKIGFFDIDADVEECIIMTYAIPEDIIVKLDVLGVRGLIIQKDEKNFSMPWIQIDDDVFHKISRHHGKKIWLRPVAREIIITE